MNYTKLQQFFIDTFGLTPQSKKEISRYLRRYILEKDFINQNLELFDENLITENKEHIITKFGNDFYLQLQETSLQHHTIVQNTLNDIIDTVCDNN